MEICWIDNNKTILEFDSKDFDFNKFMRKAIKNKKTRKALIVMLAASLIIIDIKTNGAVVPVGSIETGLTKVDSVGHMLLKLAQKFGKWAFLIMGLVNIIRDGMEGASKDSIIKTVIKYLIMFISLFALPWAFELVESF